MLLTTAHSVEGYRIRKYGPLVASEAVMGTNIFRDYFAKVRDVVGGRSGSFQTALADAREAILEEIQEQAQAEGCNAIIAIDIDYGEISGSGKTMMMVAAQGTAVYIEPA
ncbi:MAG: heavy metal-binding domain-containing protein [Alphaproteobacteria bacterium]|nr:heavy metal-binding domain-containing protein [Alphaproteobacteria bacterium]MDD9919662.1 heavy metal-binding domain-containing protein [Alphaproteobacteria bacterium]